MRTLLICQEDEAITREGLARWLAHVSELVGVVIIREPPKRRWRRVQREFARSGILGLIDVLLFRAYYRLAHADRDRRWHREQLDELKRRFPSAPAVPQIVAASPNSEAVKGFMQAHACDIAVVRCKTLLRPSIFTLPRVGSFVMHPGICPEYRNAHGCFWALAQGDAHNVGMTLLKIDAGIDTGPVYGYYRASFDSLRDSHVVIQDRVVLANLSEIASMLQRITEGQARALPTQGRPSAEWGQPRLTAYLRWKRRARRAWRARENGAPLLYHDVTNAGRFDDSGFVSAGADFYKLTREAFRAHLDALANVFPNGPALVTEEGLPRSAFLLTFDDGGGSAWEIAETLERRGWRGHFFITTGMIGQRGFMNADQIRELHRRGHAIGSHSVSHPDIMSALGRHEVLAEWRDSLAALSRITGRPISLASVPGGYCGKVVIEEAARAGVKVLFTSEPTSRLRRVAGIHVIGRYSVRCDTSAPRAALLASDRSAQLTESLRWKALTIAKAILGSRYPHWRERLLREKARA